MTFVDEALILLYQDYLLQKEIVKASYKDYEYNPLIDKVGYMPCSLDAYNLAKGKLYGFLYAKQWAIDENESTETVCVVRRNSDNRVIKRLEVQI